MKKKFLALGMVVTLVSALVVPATVLAQPTDTTEISGVLAEFLELSAPWDINFGTLLPGTHSDYSGGSVRSSLNWSLTVMASHVTVIDDEEYAQMSRFNLGVHNLTNPLLIGFPWWYNGQLGSLDDYREALEELDGYGSPGYFSIPLLVVQEITTDDMELPVGSYLVVLTYIVSPEV